MIRNQADPGAPAHNGRLDAAAIVAAAHARRVTYVAARFAPIWRRVGGIFAGLAEWWRGTLRQRQTRDELMRLDDRELVDIGLRRCDIDRIVQEAANWNQPTNRAA